MPYLLVTNIRQSNLSIYLGGGNGATKRVELNKIANVVLEAEEMQVDLFLCAKIKNGMMSQSTNKVITTTFG